MKFGLKDKVRVIADGEEGVIVSFSGDASGFTYRLTSREVDLKAKEIIDGFKICREEELELVEKAKKEKANEE